MSKKSLGQFFTTNVEDILDGMADYVGGKEVVDPFAGKCDLLTWAKKKGAVSYVGYDIDPKLINNVSVFYNDSLASIKKSEFIITNPPYLAKNKMSGDQKAELNTKSNDLYLLAIERIIDSDSKEGIAIVPVNFFSSCRANKTLCKFLSKYKIDKINYFTKRVFEDTAYNVVAFHFIEDSKNAEQRELSFRFLPENMTYTYVVKKQYDYKVAGDEIAEISSIGNPIRARRLTESALHENGGRYTINAYLNDFKNEEKYKVSKQLRDDISRNIIVIKCIDLVGDDKIRAENINDYDRNCLVDKEGSRNMMHVMLDDISTKDQIMLIDRFNKHLNIMRDKYRSLFLANFRDGNRKRISFDFCYDLLNYCYHMLVIERAKQLT